MQNKHFMVVILAAAAMLLAGFAMWPSAQNGFVWDDGGYVSANPQVYDLSVKGVKRIFSEAHFGLYKPVAILSLAVNHHFSGNNPRAYHITNIVVHAVNTALVFALVFMLLRNEWAAFLCAALFGVHPMHVESVAWVCERKDMLYALFFLLASILYVKFTASRKAWQLAASAACFVVSLGAKPMGITLPAVLFVYDYLLCRPFSRLLLYEKIPYALTAAAFGAVTILLLRSASQINDIYTFTDRLLFIFYGLKFYVWKLLVPTDLSAMYPLPVKNGTPLPIEFMLSPVTVLGTLVLLVKYLRHERVVMAGVAFYIITISPVLQFLGVGPVIAADRYSYLPSLGLFIPVAWYAVKGIGRLAEKKRVWRAAGASVAALVLAGGVFASRARCQVWYNDYTLFADAAEKYPVPAVLNQFGEALLAAGDYDRALLVYKTAVDLSMPLSVTASNCADVMRIMSSMANILFLQGKDAEAERLARHVFEITPCEGPWNLVLARVLDKKGEYDEALAVLEPVKKSFGLDAQAYFIEGEIYTRKGDMAKACGAYARAHDLNPRYAPIAEHKACSGVRF